MPRLELDQRLELGLVDGALALEGHGRHDRVLDHAHMDGGAAPLDAHVGEDAGGKQRLDGLVGLGRVVGATLGELQAGADGLGSTVRLPVISMAAIVSAAPARTRGQPAKQQGDTRNGQANQRRRIHQHRRYGAERLAGKRPAPPQTCSGAASPCPTT